MCSSTPLLKGDHLSIQHDVNSIVTTISKTINFVVIENSKVVEEMPCTQYCRVYIHDGI